MPEQLYDIIIIGGGPAGLTAGLYASRGGMKALLLEKMGCGGQSMITDWIENYPGFPEGISGFDLASRIEEQARRFGLEVRLEEVTGVMNRSVPEKAVVTPEDTYVAAALIISSGARHKMLNVPGELELRGRGVSYCATCDGPFFREKDVVVVGGGNSAVQEALFLTKFAKSVTLVHRRDRLRAAKVLQERALAHPKMRFMWNSVVESIGGKDKVEGVRLRNVIDGSTGETAASGVFVFVGLVPNTTILKGLVSMDEAGYISTDDTMKTSTEGIFACGDARIKILRQVVTAAGEGAVAAFAAEEYVENLRGTAYK
ncbi:MAG: thioredoxin-disulfide reductase [Endomicrobiales bacterium]